MPITSKPVFLFESGGKEVLQWNSRFYNKNLRETTVYKMDSHKERNPIELSRCVRSQIWFNFGWYSWRWSSENDGLGSGTHITPFQALILMGSQHNILSSRRTRTVTNRVSFESVHTFQIFLEEIHEFRKKAPFWPIFGQAKTTQTKKTFLPVLMHPAKFGSILTKKNKGNVRVETAE